MPLGELLRTISRRGTKIVEVPSENSIFVIRRSDNANGKPTEQTLLVGQRVVIFEQGEDCVAVTPDTPTMAYVQVRRGTSIHNGQWKIDESSGKGDAGIIWRGKSITRKKVVPGVNFNSLETAILFPGGSVIVQPSRR